MSPAKKRGNGTAITVHASLLPADQPSTTSRGTNQIRPSATNSPTYDATTGSRSRIAARFAAMTINKTPATTAVVTIHVAPK